VVLALTFVQFAWHHEVDEDFRFGLQSRAKRAYKSRADELLALKFRFNDI
jgi:hypothetical protein